MPRKPRVIPKTLFTGPGTLYVLRKTSYKLLGDSDEFAEFSIKLISTCIEDGPTSYSLVILERENEEDEEEVLTQPIGNGLTIGYSNKECSVHWPAIIDGKLENMAFKFINNNSKETPQILVSRFVEMYNRCTYALMTGSKVDETFSDTEAFEYVGGSATTLLPEDDYEEPVFELDLTHEGYNTTGVGAVCYSESVQFNRALVVRESDKGIEVQAHGFNRDGFSRGAPDKISLRGIKSCDEALLDDTERKMLMLSVEDECLRQVDLEHGTIIQEFKPPAKVNSVTYSSHVAGPDSVYTCLSNNVAFNMDLRMDPRKNIIVEPGLNISDYRLTSMKKQFTCAATSANGYLVLGDAEGNIRLYTGPPGSRREDGTHNPKSAKTLLKTKTPIIGVDVTADGKYVVAVSSKFLMFMPTRYIDKNGKETTGFISKMGEKKPPPLRLEPTPGQLKALGGINKLDFTSCKFDRYDGNQEVCITACSGNYIFTWSLDAVKRAAESGRACLGESALVRHEVIGVSASIPNHVMYLTDHDIRMAPLKRQKRIEKGSKNYSYS